MKKELGQIKKIIYQHNKKMQKDPNYKDGLYMGCQGSSAG